MKILFNKKDNALVQMSDPTQAQLVINYLDKINLFGSVLKISISKYSNVQMPKDGQPDSGLTKDYTSSPLHRFKKPGSKNYQNIFPPSATLHLSNIPSTCTEQKLREAFESVAQVKVVNFKFFPNDQKMALIQLNAIEDAVSALIVSLFAHGLILIRSSYDHLMTEIFTPKLTSTNLISLLLPENAQLSTERIQSSPRLILEVIDLSIIFVP